MSPTEAVRRALDGKAVHVHNGRLVHYAADDVLTLCGQAWVGTFLETTTRLPCTSCLRKVERRQQETTAP